MYHVIRWLRQLRRYVDLDTVKQLVSAVIFSRLDQGGLDYCNAVLYVLAQSTISPSQRVQNAAARVVLGLSPSDHVRPALKELHCCSFTGFSTKWCCSCLWSITITVLCTWENLSRLLAVIQLVDVFLSPPALATFHGPET